MLPIPDPAAVSSIDEVAVRELVASRLDAMTDGEPFDPDLHGCVVLVQPGDTLETIESAIGTLLLPRDGRVAAVPECVEAHPTCYELVFVPGDGDFGIVVFVPRQGDVDARLLALCAAHESCG